MTFGDDWGWGSSVTDAESILTAFLDRGGNFIDTANFYTKGHSEKIIGDYVRRRGIRRDQLVIATKFFANLFPGDPNAGGSSRKSMGPLVTSRSDGSRPTTSISIGCMAGTDSRRSKKPCVRSTT